MRNLSTKGLSLSQASSVSNLCNQRALDIDREINSINNFSREIEYSGKTLTETKGNPIPDNIIELLKEKGKLHATQAFLMEAIKEKERALLQVKNDKFQYDVSGPEYPELEQFQPVEPVTEHFGWSQLTDSEYNEYLESESYASHIGQFIHKGSKLNQLRSDLPNVRSLEWMEIKAGEKIPVIIKSHHTQDDLLELHNKLAELHRQYESRVNYFKAKVKNLTTMENARIAKENKDTLDAINLRNEEKLNEYYKLDKEYSNRVHSLSKQFETDRFNKIQELSGLRIQVDKRFAETIDKYLIQE